MKKYGLHGKLEASQGNRDKLAEILLEASVLVAKAKGCIVYAISTQEGDLNNVWISELWESKEDHDYSLSSPGVRELIMKAMPLLAGQPEKGQELVVLGGHGV